jgi:RHS repeat-associated protein
VGIFVTDYKMTAAGGPGLAVFETWGAVLFGRAVEQNRSGTNTQIVYGPSGAKFAFMNGSTLIEYIDPMVAGMAAIHNGNGTGYFQHADWLGSSRFAQDGGGNVIYDRAYAPFGEPYDEYNNVTTNRNFTAQTEDTTPGLYDFLLRQQSPAQGRWLVPDPAGLAAVDITNPQTWNRYAYLANNPLNATDPLGLYCSVDDSDTIGECGDDWFDDFAIFCCTGGGGGVGHRGGGGGGGGGGQPPPQQPINFPNETLGLPNGFPTNPWGSWGAIIPTAQCGDITCPPIGSGWTIDPAAVSSAESAIGSWTGALATTLWGWFGNTGDPNDTRRLFNTKWCGPGGGGTPVNGLDQACMQHDLCYQAIRANPEDNGNGSFWNGAALQACNQQLCNAASQSSDVGAAQVLWYFQNKGLYRCHQ